MPQDNHEICQALDRVLIGKKNLLIVMHDNPDPDAIASAWALQFLVKNQYQIESKLAYGGFIGRAENRAMVRELKIQLKRINRIRFSEYDCIALMDTQPGSGNHSLPKNIKCHIVFDHHSRKRGLKADFAMIKPDLGTTATLIYQCLEAFNLTISADLATALAYGIRSDTQDLGREASKQDINAYLAVYSRSSVRKLAKITQPRLSRSYFIHIYEAIKQTKVFRHIMCIHLEDIPYPEIVGEIADLMLRYKGISWCLCTGRYHKNLILSLRSSNRKANSRVIIQKLVRDAKSAGGHDLFAGGKIKLTSSSKNELNEMQNQISQDFVRLIGYHEANWKSLIEEP